MAVGQQRDQYVADYRRLAQQRRADRLLHCQNAVTIRHALALPCILLCGRPLLPTGDRRASAAGDAALAGLGYAACRVCALSQYE